MLTLSTILCAALGLSALLYLMQAHAVLGTGIPSGRAGLDMLLKNVVVSGNITGAAASAAITVTGIQPGDSVLFVQAGDGTDLGAATIAVTAANTITCSVSTAAKKLNVCWLKRSAASGQQDIGTEYDAYYGILDALLAKLTVKVVAGAAGALTVTGIAATDILFSVFVTDATVDCSDDTWTVTADTVTPADSKDTSGKYVCVMYIDVSATSPPNSSDINSALPIPRVGHYNPFLRGLRLVAFTGPNGSGDVAVAWLAEDDNLLGLWYEDSTLDPLDAAWTVKAGGGNLNYAGSANLSAGKVHALIGDISQAAA